MTLNMTRMPSGPAETNAYLIADSDTGDAMLVDTPPDILPLVQQAIQSAGVTLRFIVITHGHWDHITGAAEVLAQWPVPVIGHEMVRARLENPSKADMSPLPMTPVKLDETVSEGDELKVGNHVFRVMYMPGHDPAHITLYSEADGMMLGGDVLFPDGHGRTDLPGSDQQVMNATLKRFLELPGETRVFPGHGSVTRVQREAHWIRGLQ